MKIRELQEYLKDRLNGIEALVQGGCKAFAEDTRTVYDESAQFISEGGVALGVVTPDFQRAGDGADGIPVEGDVLVRCVEKPPSPRPPQIPSARWTRRRPSAATSSRSPASGTTPSPSPPWPRSAKPASARRRLLWASCRRR